MKETLVDFDKFDFDRVIADRDAIKAINPHRFEMQLLDGILFQDEIFAVGYKDVSDEAFWVRGHFPDKPLMPGVLICECAAQLSSYYASVTKVVDSGYIGLAGLDKIRFRGPVVPGDRLLIMLKRGKVRRNVMFNAAFQGYIDRQLVVDGIITGVALGE